MNLKNLPNNLVILEMANNHNGSIDHAFKIFNEFMCLIDDFPEFKFAFKLQYRDLDSFIRPDMKGRLDIKHIKRFEDTRLSENHYIQMVNKIKELGFISMCTPFDEKSVDTILDHKIEILKIASCSFSDWPLLEKAASAGLPIIASTAGASLETIDQVILFFKNRNINFAIQHCVGEYPTKTSKMNLNQLDFLKNRYPDVRFGFSTHEDPNNVDIAKIAIAKGASLLEKHVGIASEKYPLNAYSSSLAQTILWLKSAKSTMQACGVIGKRHEASQSEVSSLLSLRRGVFAKKHLKIGQELKESDYFLAFPPNENQLTASHLSKYNKITLTKTLDINEPIDISKCNVQYQRKNLLIEADKIKEFIQKSNVVVPTNFQLEISHHYGLENFSTFGLSMITLVNREYCKKILITLPGQKHPEQFHNKKEETFHILHGTLEISLNQKKRKLDVGDVITIMPGIKHEFSSENGCIIEEISSTHYKDDSFYTDKEIHLNKERKSLLFVNMND